MFSENNRISERQASRLLTYDLLGLSTLLVPTLLSNVAGRDGIFCIAIGVAASVLYLWILCVLVEDCTTTFSAYLEQKLGKFVGRAVQGGFFLYLLLLAGYTAYLFCDVVLQSLLREESFYLVLILVLLLALYGLWGGLEGRARVYEILYWFLMIPLFIMLFFALDEIRTDYWSPVFVSDAGDIFAGSYYVFLSFAIIFLVLFLGNYMKKKERLFVAGRRALLFTGGVHAALYLILLGIFGADALGSMQYPAVTLMSTVRISGGFLKRADAFMFAIWFFTLYALLASCIFYSGNVLVQILGKCLQKYGEQKRQHGAYTVVVVLVGVIACCFYKEHAWMEDYEWILWHIGTPFVVLVPVILIAFIHRSGRKKDDRAGRRGNRTEKCAGMFALVLLSGSILTGCGTAELEERDFPIEIAVQNTDDFAQEFLDAESSGSRTIDYSHLKVMILSQAFIEDEASMRELLELLEKKNEIPQNVYLVVAENAKELLNCKDVLNESVGNYLEKMFENVSEVRKQEYPTLGMLYQERDNQNETFFIPYVSEGEEELVIERYYVWRRGEAFGIVDSRTAMLSFFTQNQMEKYQMTLEDGTVVSLSDAHNKLSFSEQEGKKTVVANIRCSGEVISAGATAENGQQLAWQIEAYMNRIAEQTLAELQIDVTNSFRKLGAKRDWYFYYQGQKNAYEQDIDVIYDVSVDWINL